jgi:diphthamide synthase (EF-2-diphthine--ammonia ligase)
MGAEGMAFGDLHLEDVRAYRETLFEETGLAPLFPIWGEDTRELAERMLASGVQAYITCVDPAALPSGLAGRAFDGSLLRELPDEVDPCGERGEFHTFVWSAPVFSSPIPVRVGGIVNRDGFVFADILPAWN